MSTLERRKFLATSAGACLVGIGAGSMPAASRAAEGAAAAPQQYFEWRTYRVTSDDQQQQVRRYLGEAALPVWENVGLGPVGIFTETGADATLAVHALLTYPTLDVFAKTRAAIEKEAWGKAPQYIGAKKDDPAFDRIESSLLLAFEGMPQLKAPTGAGLYEVRVYQSHSEERARRKVQMFNEGEIEIFSEAGFQPVFFSECLIGANVPHLRYMLAAKDMEANEACWKNFVSAPAWAAMKDRPRYADSVSAIAKTYLKPTAESQV